VAEYKFQIIFPKGFIEGLNDLYQLRTKTLERFYFSSLQSFLAFVCFIAGLVLVFARNNIFLKMAVSIVTLSFILFIIKAGSFFSNHSYYIISYTPVMALVSGFFISKIKARYQWILLVLIAIEGIANQQHDFFIRDNELYKLTLEQIADRHIGKNELIVINGGNSPQQIYFTNRKGWTVDNEAITDKTKMDEFRLKGAAYLIVNKISFSEDLDFPEIYADNHFIIYKLL
jgi:energy-coupling factor transporter transmembrane protein EcfT